MFLSSRIVDVEARAGFGNPAFESQPDLEIFDSSMDCPRTGFVFDAEHPELCVRAILKRRPDLMLALARHLTPFREPVVK